MKKNITISLTILLYLLIPQFTSIYAEILPEISEEIIPMPETSSGSVVLIDAATGLVLYENEAKTQKYPASVTKIMTAMIVLEHATDLTERVEFCDDSVWGIPRNSSHIYMDVGETLSIYEALYALMLESANEVSVALAIHIAGSVEEFVDLMNRRAAQIGLSDTHFVNPHGLPARGHVTTAYDMALIMREAVRNPIFARIISYVRFDIPPTERQPNTRHLLNFHQMIRQGQFYNESVVGGKTGWTTAAGHTLVTYAEQDGRRLIAVVLQGEGNSTFNDTAALLRYGFALPMEYVTVFDASAYSITTPVLQEIGGSSVEIGRVRLMSDRDMKFELPHNWSNSWLRYELSVPETLAPPVLPGDAVGRVAVYVQNVRVGEAELTARDAVFAYTPPDPATVAAYYDYAAADAYEIPEAPVFFTGRWAFLNNEYVLTLAVPLAISCVTLFISLIVVLTRHKRRARRLLRARRAKFARYPHYRYK
ncbi:MAG: D-alanyl-D-alanine carboxypeptidase [Defluviitaleaceae bacterium]|nr:D-alanyl-D-alanine carboxypeptidase [Defluviitaleaceae bacterium]